MKHTPSPQSATSLPRAPRDDAGARSRRYLVMMGIRVACFVAMVLITPYGWYTWVLGAAAIFLPYIAVVLANVGSDVGGEAESPELALPAAPSAPPPQPESPATDTHVIRIEESHSPDPDAKA
ncbi:DUF3099 domain-containing protein [Microbacterium terricola]|uniref:DUF3099 domain-containing protein n=1 Tax=Microbacterium terricola TaxID=344163 RepID=A0ABM8DY06_9MICO|nr:DUF3099 domain-containing protein [Microbacterium terricola]UYK38820.1 DUF3099 domain-containing protein [Microbacterium terricola]BDV30485.1 hypothetical protein Microterr_11450 [Microbacterium terricola]